MEASKRGKTKKNCPRKLIRPPPAGVLVDSGAVVLGAPALLLPGCQPRRHPLPAPPSTGCAYRNGESLPHHHPYNHSQPPCRPAPHHLRPHHHGDPQTITIIINPAVVIIHPHHLLYV